MFEQLHMKVFLLLCQQAYLLYASISDRHIHLQVVPSKWAFGEAIQEKVLDRLLDCVYQCIVDQGCGSMSFNKTDGLCRLYSSTVTMDREPGSSLLCASLTTAPAESKTSVNDESPENTSALIMTNRSAVHPRLVSLNHTITYIQAEKECLKMSVLLFQIDSEEKQIMAVNMARGSGLDYIAIGVFMQSFSWRYADGKRVNYTAWAPDSAWGFWVALSKSYNYQWVKIMHGVDGYICEH